jgi:hypothetical protein
MKTTYRGSAQAQEQNPFAGTTMTFYMAGDGEGGQTLCGGLDTIPAEAQTALDTMTTPRRKQFLRRLIEEGDRVFRSAWEQSLDLFNNPVGCLTSLAVFQAKAFQKRSFYRKFFINKRFIKNSIKYKKKNGLSKR